MTEGQIFMPRRWDNWGGYRQLGQFGLALAMILIVTASQASETNSTSSISDKWQRAKEGSSNAWDSVKHGTTNAWSSVKSGATQSWERARETFEPGKGKTNYVYEKKDAFVSKAKTEVDEIDGKMKELSDKTSSATESVKSQMQQKMAALKGKRSDLSAKLDKAKGATQEDWNKAQVEFQKAYDDTKQSVRDAWDWLKTKTD